LLAARASNECLLIASAISTAGRRNPFQYTMMTRSLSLDKKQQCNEKILSNSQTKIYMAVCTSIVSSDLRIVYGWNILCYPITKLTNPVHCYGETTALYIYRLLATDLFMHTNYIHNQTASNTVPYEQTNLYYTSHLELIQPHW